MGGASPLGRTMYAECYLLFEPVFDDGALLSGLPVFCVVVGFFEVLLLDLPVVDVLVELPVVDLPVVDVLVELPVVDVLVLVVGLLDSFFVV